ncbi:MAG: rRNA maturation RNase YbeY [bacterium]|nr:rRNA maturation RNase YbeY [bacterium]
MIEINNLTTNPVDKEFLEKVAKKVLMGENKEKLELSIVLVGQARIRKLNKKYRQNYRSTDVLSFAYDNSGEIVICLPEVKKNAKKLKSVFRKELAKVLIHGILHLLGYDHEKSEKAMEGEESKLSSSPTELPKEAKVRKRVKSSFDFAIAREMEEKQEHYLRKIYG